MPATGPDKELHPLIASFTETPFSDIITESSANFIPFFQNITKEAKEMPYEDVRAFLNRLESKGELIRIKEELDPKYEVAAVLHELGQKDSPAVFFEKVKGYDVPVAGNLFGRRRRFALALETEEGDIEGKLDRGKGAPIAPVMVEEAAVKQVILKDEIDLLKVIPILSHSEKDAGPYITQGVLFLKDPETGDRTMGVHRMQAKGKDGICAYISSLGKSFVFLQKAEAKDQPLEAAIAIGNDPVVVMAAVAYLPLGDKFGLAGGLRGEPMKLVKAETVDLDVPANAMFVLEGEILPHVREVDGPFGESLGYYTTINSPVIQIKAITHQREPIYTVFPPYSVEQELMYELNFVPEMRRMLKMSIPSLQDVTYIYTLATLVLSIKKGKGWEGRQALYTALSMGPLVKFAIVVDDDVNIHDFRELACALAGRAQPEEDAVLFSGIYGHELDPSCKEDFVSSKMGLDATKPLEHPEHFEMARPPHPARDKAKKILRGYL
jgi:2,5-furandicarboxylate decarboxylase 1